MLALCRGLLPVVLVALLGGGCAGGPDPATPGGSTSPAVAGPSTTPSEAGVDVNATAADRRYLRRGIGSVIAAVTAGRPLGFTFDMGSEESPYLEGSGVYEVDPGRWAATTVLDASQFGQQGSPITMHVRSHGRDLWMQMADWPDPQQGCWLRMGPGQVPVGLLAMQPGEPVFVSVLAGLEAGPRDGADRMTGGLGLQYALNLLPGQTVGRIDLAGVGRGHDVPVELTFDAGRLVSLLVRGEDVHETLLAAGAVVPGTAEEPIDEVLAVLDVRIGFTASRTGPADGYRPPAGTAFRAGDEGCPAG